MSKQIVDELFQRAIHIGRIKEKLDEYDDAVFPTYPSNRRRDANASARELEQMLEEIGTDWSEKILDAFDAKNFYSDEARILVGNIQDNDVETLRSIPNCEALVKTWFERNLETAEKYPLGPAELTLGVSWDAFGLEIPLPQMDESTAYWIDHARDEAKNMAMGVY